MKKQLIYILFSLITFSLYAQDDASLNVISESSIYISGDLLRLQIIPTGPDGAMIDENKLIDAYLVHSSGEVVAEQRFMITQLDKNASMYLPEDLETGNYKFITHLPGTDTQNEIVLHVYNPNVFSSSVSPKNADVTAGPSSSLSADAKTVNVRMASAGKRSSLTIPKLSDNDHTPLTGVVMVFNPEVTTYPVIGTITNTSISKGEQMKFQFDWRTEEPNARVSFYFLEQELVEEYYMAEQDKMIAGLQQHYGSGPFWAYQFDQEGNRIGDVKVSVSERNVSVFNSFDNTVPFNQDVLDILEHKRIRKYVDQVYGKKSEEVESLQEEEYNRSPDAIIYPDRYEGLATLREALSNIVPKTQVIRRDGKYEIRLSPANSGFRYTESPLVIINGAPLYTLDSLLEMPVSRVKSISTYNSLEKLRRFGTLGRFGVIEIKLQEPDKSIESYRNALPTINGISDLVVTNPDLQEGSPDLRSVVFWDPSRRVYPDRPNEVQWVMSDIPGNLVAWGLLLNGKGEWFTFENSIQYNHTRK